jgi:hypothetical protein
MSGKRGRPSSRVHALFVAIDEDECEKLERGPSARCRFCAKLIYNKTANKKLHLENCAEFDQVRIVGVADNDEMTRAVAAYLGSLGDDGASKSTAHEGGAAADAFTAKRALVAGEREVEGDGHCCADHDSGSSAAEAQLGHPRREDGQDESPLAPHDNGFEVFVSKESFKFNAAHFIAFKVRRFVVLDCG